MATDAYWSIDVPGLDVGGAETLTRAAARIPNVLGVTKVDPELWLTRHLDSEAVRVLVEAMQVAILSGQMADEAVWESLRCSKTSRNG